MHPSKVNVDVVKFKRNINIINLQKDERFIF